MAREYMFSNLTSAEFVVKWMEYYKAGKSTGDFAYDNHISISNAYSRAWRYRKMGIPLPYLDSRHRGKKPVDVESLKLIVEKELRG